MSSLKITGKFVDIEQKKIYPAVVSIDAGKILSVVPVETPVDDQYILPGFIDSHVHIESSMLVPSEFAKIAVVHGTVSTVSDPHEIANVCGIEGVEFMIENGMTVPFKFNFGAPSCVPATTFETAGDALDAAAVESLLQRKEILYLSEMMNFPGVLHQDDEVMKKIAAAHAAGKPVDGHAPGLRGDQAKKYIDAGISTDHECFTREEAVDKLKYGMKIIIREGSAAKNFEALIDLLNDHEDEMMFCSDDKHPDSLVLGHINLLCQRAVAKGIDVFKILKAACVNPVKHYKLDVGLLHAGDHADFILVKDLVQFKVLATYINGQRVAENGQSLIVTETSPVINRFSCLPKTVTDFEIPWSGEKEIPVIEALEGQLITNKLMLGPAIENNKMISDTERDILKIVVINRYQDAPVAKAFIRNFGLKRGALASSVAHDSHNIIAVGADDESLCLAVNKIIESKGGISTAECFAVPGNPEMTRNFSVLPLPVAGLMSNFDGDMIATIYSALDAEAKSFGSTLAAPFMTLSFMALLVIPHLKLSDKGLFDGDGFRFISLPT
jgi:adenine deaminase